MFMGVITNNQQIRLMFLDTQGFEGLLINLSSSKKGLILTTARSLAKEKQSTSAKTAYLSSKVYTQVTKLLWHRLQDCS